MNLAEFPLTVLSTRVSAKVKTLDFRDSVRSKNGELIDRKWIITGADKFGLPTASDDEVLLGLLKLTVDQGFETAKVYFTRYELLKVLRWSTEGRSYSRLQRALDRLSGVRIKATNAFFDNSTKSHSTVNFGIIDAYELNDGRDGSVNGTAPSFFVWSDVLFDSFQVGYIKKLDLDFYLELKSAVSKRVYRYLDKHFWYKSVLRTNLFTLAHEKLGISRNYQYISSLRQQLDSALDELVQTGFISGYEYAGKGRETEIIIRAKQGQRSLKESAKQTGEGNFPDHAVKVDLGSEFDKLKTELSAALIQRGIRDVQVKKLLTNRSLQELQRMGRIIQHYDQLLHSRSRLVSLSPVGFLFRAVEHPQQFRLPGEHDSGQESFSFTARSSEMQKTAQQKSAPQREDLSRLQSDYLVARKKEIVRLKAEVEPKLLETVKHEVDTALSRLRGVIDEARFSDAVEHGVEEKLASLFAYPSFEEWVRGRSRRNLR